jgi:hypothetical protein
MRKMKVRKEKRRRGKRKDLYQHKVVFADHLDGNGQAVLLRVERAHNTTENTLAGEPNHLVPSVQHLTGLHT